MKDLNGEQTLLAALPILLILLALVGALMFSQGGLFDVRSKAAPLPTPALTKITITIAPSKPQTVCSQLYTPVCGIDGITYNTACDADNTNITVNYKGQCRSSTPTATPVLLPSSY